MEGDSHNDLIYITVVIEPVDDREMYLRQSVISLTDKETDEDVGSVDTTAGLGGDLILLNWHGRRGKLRMSHILRQWVRSFDEAGARRLPVVGPADAEPPAPVKLDGETRERLVDRIEDAMREQDDEG